MDLHADSEPEAIVISTSDAESTPKRARNAKPFIKSFSFLPSLLKRLQTSGTSGTHARKYAETKPGRQVADHRPITNYNNNYFINGGRGGSGGEGGDQGGDGGTGQGPTVYFGQPHERESSDFQTIRLGDLKLVKDVRLGLQFGVVGRQSRGVSVRRMYHAKIRRDPGTVTAVMYQGDGAEEEWRQHVAKYESIRHPNVMQLYGLVSTKGLYAMVFHDELIPYDQFFGRFQHSPILSAYIIGYCTPQFWEAYHYCRNLSFRLDYDYPDYPSVWIRSTGELCLDVAQQGPRMGSRLNKWHEFVLRLEKVSLDAPDSENRIISSLSEDQYHEICSQPSIGRRQYFQVSTKHPVGPGIFRPDSQYGTCVGITKTLVYAEEEICWDDYRGAACQLLPNSWIRFDSHQTPILDLSLLATSYEIRMAWLAQANCIFAELEEEAHVENYVCVNHIEFRLRIAEKHHIPEGYLFVCPPQDFRTGIKPQGHLYQWPACPAYWSLDPSGADRLGTEDARILGFPTIHIETIIFGESWDRRVYQGLRRFHEGKGLDPESQEVARRQGYPLYEVLSDSVPFPARKVNDWPWDCEQDDPPLCRLLGHYL